MSFILDALKKSEAERQRQNAPGIASIPEKGQGASRGKWLWVIVALLVVNLLVLTGIVVNRGQGDPPVSTVEVPVEPAASSTDQSSFAEIVREARQATPAPVAGNDPENQPETVTAASATLPAPTAVAAPAERRAAITEGLPTLNDLTGRGALQLPELHLDIHVYSGEPSERFVFVNMVKYKERGKLAEGPTITEIVPEGVVLDYLGTRFLLPRE